MKKFLNVLIVTFIFMIGNYLWPEAIIIDSTRTLVIAAITYLVCDYVFAFAIVGISGILAITMNAFLLFVWGIAIFVIALAWIPMKLWILSNYIPGFSIVGTMTWIILTILILSFATEKNVENKKVSY